MKWPISMVLPVALTAGPAFADVMERLVWGEVIDVQPVTQRLTYPPADECRHHTKPLFDADLAALLAWDLDPACAATQATRTVAYRVKYHWDGRSYVMMMDAHPGGKVPLRLRLR